MIPLQSTPGGVELVCEENWLKISGEWPFKILHKICEINKDFSDSMLFHFGHIPGKCTVCILSTVLNKQTNN